MVQRKIINIITGMKTSDGAGVNLTRIIGSPELNMLDPFLLLDEFGSNDPNDYIAGFPPHPHRGFETITYMLNGKWQHQDSAGNEGLLGEGSVQWMTAGRGIVHSEMPI
jgi:redox-sensitive bicupin YhaK (pirin superfamily)